METKVDTATAIAVVAEKSFRFCDLPLEIRNEIYTILLCTFNHIDDANSIPCLDGQSENPLIHLQHDWHPAIFQVCHAIHREAEDIVRRANLYIHVVAPKHFYDFFMIPVQLPHFPPRQAKGILTKHSMGTVVLKHKVIEHDEGERIYQNHIILFRDQDRLIDCLRLCITWEQTYANLSHHRIVVSRPENPDGLVENRFSTEFQQTVVTPYRSLRGCRNFTVTGIDEALAKLVVADVKRPREIRDFSDILQEVRAYKLKGNTAYSTSHESQALEAWRTGVFVVDNDVGGDRRRRVCEAGGQNFVNSIAELEFTMRSNLLILRMKPLFDNYRELTLRAGKGEAESLLKNFCLTRDVPRKWGKYGSTWKMSAIQLAKLNYREAVALRLFGGLLQLQQAAEYIKSALETCPGDSKLLAEKELNLEASIIRGLVLG